MKKRVLCLIESLGSGGAERQLAGLAAMLKKDGNDVKVATYVSKDFYKPVLDEAGCEYEYIPNALSPHKRFLKLAKVIRQYQPDVVIAYSPATAEIACVLKRMSFKFNLIVSERSTTQYLSRSEKIKFFCYRWADWIVPNSQVQGEFIKNHYPRLAAKVRVITNFVDTDYFSPIDEERELSDVYRMICVGRDDPLKNILRFIDALKLLSDKNVKIHVDWYGKFENAYGQQCREKIDKLCLNDLITLKGETRSVRDEYRKHDVFCIPSIIEGFPNVLCEAMSCGLPALCSNVCDNPTILENNKGGLLFEPTDANDMAEKIEQFVRLDNMKKKEMGRHNREKALAMFSPSAFLSKYKEIL